MSMLSMHVGRLERKARQEYDDDGTFHTDTYMELQDAGINPEVLLAQFTTEKES